MTFAKALRYLVGSPHRDQYDVAFDCRIVNSVYVFYKDRKLYAYLHSYSVPDADVQLNQDQLHMIIAEDSDTWEISKWDYVGWRPPDELS
jgi:hypothetical protein